MIGKIRLRSLVYLISTLLIVTTVLWLLNWQISLNPYKDQLTTLVKKNSDYQINITGNLTASLLPLGIQATECTLKSKTLTVQARALKARFNLFKILIGNLGLQSLTLDDIQLALPQHKATAKTLRIKNIDLSLRQPDLATLPQFGIGKVHLVEGTYQGTQKITDLHLKGDNLRLQSTRILGKIDLRYAQSTATINVNLDHQQLTPTAAQVDLQIHELNIPQISTLLGISPTADIPQRVTGRLSCHKQGHHLKIHLKSYLDKGYLQGSFQAHDDPHNPDATFNVFVKDINVAPLIALANQIQPKSKPSQTSTIPNKANDKTHKVLAYLRKATVQGTLQAQRISFTPYVLKDLTVPIKLKAGQLSLNPITLDFLGSYHTFIGLADFTKTPHYQLQGSSNTFDISPLVSPKSQKKILSGRIHDSLDLRTTGTSFNQVLAHLAGDVKIEMDQGTLHGVNISLLLKTVEEMVTALFKAASSSGTVAIAELLRSNTWNWDSSFAGKKAYSDFHTLLLHFKIDKGLATLTPETCQVLGEDFKIHGHGTIDMTQQSVNLRAQANLDPEQSKAENEVSQYLQDHPVPIKITGPFNNIHLNLDLVEYQRTLLKQLSSQFLKQQSFNIINGLINPLGGASSLLLEAAEALTGEKIPNPLDYVPLIGDK